MEINMSDSTQSSRPQRDIKVDDNLKKYYWKLIFSVCFARVVDNYPIVDLLNSNRGNLPKKQFQLENTVDYLIVILFILLSCFVLRQYLQRWEKLYFYSSFITLITGIYLIILQQFPSLYNKSNLSRDLQAGIIIFFFRFTYSFNSVYVFGYQMDLLTKSDEKNFIISFIIARFVIVFELSKILQYVLRISVHEYDCFQIYTIIITVCAFLSVAFGYQVQPFQFQLQKTKPQNHQEQSQQEQNSNQTDSILTQIISTMNIFKNSSVIQVASSQMLENNARSFTRQPQQQQQNNRQQQQFTKQARKLIPMFAVLLAYKIYQGFSQQTQQVCSFVIYQQLGYIINSLIFETGVLLGIFLIVFLCQKRTKFDDIFNYTLIIGMFLSALWVMIYLYNRQDILRFKDYRDKDQEIPQEYQTLLLMYQISDNIFSIFFGMIVGILQTVGLRIGIQRCRGEIQVYAWSFVFYYLMYFITNLLSLFQQINISVYLYCFVIFLLKCVFVYFNQIKMESLMSIEEIIDLTVYQINITIQQFAVRYSRIRKGQIKGNKVYKCKDENSYSNKTVVCKAIENNESGKNESQIFQSVQTLQNEGIAKLFNITLDEYNNKIIMAMESGVSNLEEEIQARYGNNSYFSKQQLCQIIYQFCKTSLLMWESLSLLHCDLKLTNYIKIKENNYKLIDFGMSIKFEQEYKQFGEQRYKNFDEQMIQRNINSVNYQESALKESLISTAINEDYINQEINGLLHKFCEAGTPKTKSPEKINFSQKKQFPVPVKCEVYSLGLILLQIATLKIITSYDDYDRIQQEIDELKQYLDNDSNRYAEGLKEIINNMLAPEDERPTLKQITQQITDYIKNSQRT